MEYIEAVIVWSILDTNPAGLRENTPPAYFSLTDEGIQTPRMAIFNQVSNSGFPLKSLPSQCVSGGLRE